VDFVVVSAGHGFGGRAPVFENREFLVYRTQSGRE